MSHHAGQVALKKPSVLLAALGLGGGTGSGFEAEYQAVITYATAQGFVLPSPENQLAQNALVKSLKTGGIWTKLDIFYNFYTDGSASFAKINWKAPGTFQAVTTGTTFKHNQGFLKTAAGDQINTGWNPNVNGVNWTLADASTFLDSFDDTIVGAISFFQALNAANLGRSQLSLLKGTAGAGRVRPVCNADTGANGPNFGDDVTTYVGLIQGSVVAGLQKGYFNGVVKNSGGTPALTQTVKTNVSLILGAINTGGTVTTLGGPVGYGCFGAGASLTGLEMTLYNAWATYKSSVYTTEYQAVLDYATAQGYTLPTLQNRQAQNTLLKTMKQSGLWAKLDVFYNFYTNGDANFAKINWKAPGTFQIGAATGVVTFIPLNGFKGSPTGELSTGIPGQTAQMNIVGGQFGYLVGFNRLANEDNIGAYGNNGGIAQYHFGGTGQVTRIFNYQNAYPCSVNDPGTEIYIYSRVGTVDHINMNGTDVFTFDAVGTPLVPNAGDIRLLSLGGYAFSSGTIKCWGCGANFFGLEAGFYTAWTTYKSTSTYGAILEYADSQGAIYPSDQQLEAGQLLVYDLMDIGAWDRLDAFYNFFTDGDGSFATINWKNPSASTLLAPAGGITFNTNDGAVGDGVVGYITTGIIPGVNTESLSLNDAGVFMDANGVTPGAKALFGALDPGIGSVALYPSIGGMSVSRAATDTDITWTAPSPADGFWLLERNAVDQVQAYLNYDLKVDSSLMASALPGFELYLFAANNAGVAQDYSDATIRCFGLGASLKQVESRLYQAWETYKARAV